MGNDPMAHPVATPSPVAKHMAHRRRARNLLRVRLAAGALIAIVILAVAMLGLGGLEPGARPTSTPPLNANVAPSARAAATPSEAATAESTWGPIVAPPTVVSRTLEPTPTPVPTPTPKPTPRPTPRPTAKPSPIALPGLIGAIGDSYTQAYSTSWSELYSHPEHSWSVGEAKGDGVYSLAERFNALGDQLLISDPAYPGRLMNDGPRQANIVVSAAARLAAGKTAFVTIALGTNDICIDNPTAPSTYTTYFQRTMARLNAGLPKGSTVLVQTLVDFSRLRSLAAAGGVYSRFASICPTFSNARLAEGRSLFAAYNKALVNVCAQYNAAGRIRCKTDLSGGISYFNRTFTLADFSTVDYFHPSLHGQGLMATSAWKTAYWASLLASATSRLG